MARHFIGDVPYSICEEHLQEKLTESTTFQYQKQNYSTIPHFYVSRDVEVVTTCCAAAALEHAGGYLSSPRQTQSTINHPSVTSTT